MNNLTLPRVLVIKKISSLEYAAFCDVLKNDFQEIDYSIKNEYSMLILNSLYYKYYFRPINRTNTIKLTLLESKAFIDYFSKRKSFEIPLCNNIINRIFDHIYQYTL